MLRKQLDKDPQFQVALELVQDKGMYNRIITPADAKVRRSCPSCLVLNVVNDTGGRRGCLLRLPVSVFVGRSQCCGRSITRLQAVPCG